jgi:4,5-DOPA dioxygenase extradiol
MTPEPTLFVSHGAPPFALEPGRAGFLLREFGKSLRKPTAILAISPHWRTTGLSVMTKAQPETLYDFGGFDPRLMQMNYPSAGHPALALKTAQLLRLQGFHVDMDQHRDYDHGVWIPLLHILPKADVPVFQLSMPHDLTAPQAIELGRALRPISKQGVMIMGTGSLTHNLYEFRLHAQSEAAYAKEFTQWVRQKVLSNDVEALIHANALAPHALRAHPSDEHYLPLLIALGAAHPEAKANVLDGGITYGVLSMESYFWETRHE